MITVRRHGCRVLATEPAPDQFQFSLGSLLAGISVFAVVLAIHAAGLEAGPIGYSCLFIFGVAAVGAPPWRSFRAFLHLTTHVFWAYCLAFIAINVFLISYLPGETALGPFMMTVPATISFVVSLLLWIGLRRFLPVSTKFHPLKKTAAYVLISLAWIWLVILVSFRADWW